MLPVWETGVPDGVLMQRQILSYEKGFTLEKANYLVSNGELEIFMPPYSAAVLNYKGEQVMWEEYQSPASLWSEKE